MSLLQLSVGRAGGFGQGVYWYRLDHRCLAKAQAQASGSDIYGGIHAHFEDKTRFLANIKTASGSSPTQSYVVIDSKAHTMSLAVGLLGKGTYSVELDKVAGCQSYFFRFMLDGRMVDYPENGVLKTISAFGDTNDPCKGTMWAPEAHLFNGQVAPSPPAAPSPLAVPTPAPVVAPSPIGVVPTPVGPVPTPFVAPTPFVVPTPAPFGVPPSPASGCDISQCAMQCQAMQQQLKGCTCLNGVPTPTCEDAQLDAPSPSGGLGTGAIVGAFLGARSPHSVWQALLLAPFATA